MNQSVRFQYVELASQLKTLLKQLYLLCTDRQGAKDPHWPQRKSVSLQVFIFLQIHFLGYNLDHQAHHIGQAQAQATLTHYYGLQLE